MSEILIEVWLYYPGDHITKFTCMPLALHRIHPSALYLLPNMEIQDRRPQYTTIQLQAMLFYHSQ